MRNPQSLLTACDIFNTNRIVKSQPYTEDIVGFALNNGRRYTSPLYGKQDRSFRIFWIKS